jgi:hypothetical protein
MYSIPILSNIEDFMNFNFTKDFIFLKCGDFDEFPYWAFILIFLHFLNFIVKFFASLC